MVTAIRKIFFLMLTTIAVCGYSTAQESSLKISFINTVKGTPIILDSAEYTNTFNEAYRIKKLKYYISDISLSVNNIKRSFTEKESYHLTDEADTASLHFTITAPANNYSSISFTIGVDSIKNVSGAQSGALDPTKGMFWTWNSGYIFLKLEGSSPSSTVINNKVEYHIGGFAGINNALKRITLQMPAGKLLQLKAGKCSEIIIEADINKLWQGPNEIKIADTPATMSPGALAIKIADNYSTIFSIKNVLNN
jgi:hypothetical protein